MLLYTLTLGPTEKSIAQQAYRSGEPMPDRIANAPQLFAGLTLYYDAFFDLDTTRSHGLGFSRISWSEIKDYAEANEYEDHQKAFLMFVIPQIDTEYQSFLTKKRLQNGNAGATGERDTEASE